MVSLISVFLILTLLVVSAYLTIPPVTAVSPLPSAPSGYATKPFAFLYNCNFTSHTIPPPKNTTSIAFNQQEYEANHWNLNASLTGPNGGYACMVGVIPSHIAARYGVQ